MSKLKIKDERWEEFERRAEEFGLEIVSDSCGNYADNLNTFLDRPNGKLLQSSNILINKHEIVIHTTVQECYKDIGLTVEVSNLSVLYELINEGFVEEV